MKTTQTTPAMMTALRNIAQTGKSRARNSGTEKALESRGLIRSWEEDGFVRLAITDAGLSVIGWHPPMSLNLTGGR